LRTLVGQKRDVAGEHYLPFHLLMATALGVGYLVAELRRRRKNYRPA